MSAKHDPDQDPYCLDSAHDELATQVSSLTAENERLRYENRGLSDSLGAAIRVGDEYREDRERFRAEVEYRKATEADLRAEVERLRAHADAMAAGAKKLAEALNRSQLVTSRQFGKTPLYDAWMAMAAAVDTYETTREEA